MEVLNYQETAQALNLPLGAVKTRLARARLLLRNRLSRYHDPGPDALHEAVEHQMVEEYL